MKCKTDNPGKGEFECLKEGRRVTRCARSVYVRLLSVVIYFMLYLVVQERGFQDMGDRPRMQRLGGCLSHATMGTFTDCQSRSIEDINTHCLAEFKKHWECLENNNHQLWQCRPAEWRLNKCVFHNLVRFSHPPKCSLGGLLTPHATET